MAWNLNIEALSMKAYEALVKLDNKFVGTEEYMGIVYFWGHRYKHMLRDANTRDRRRVHAGFLAAGLTPHGETKAHDRIMDAVFHTDYTND